MYCLIDLGSNITLVSRQVIQYIRFMSMNFLEIRPVQRDKFGGFETLGTAETSIKLGRHAMQCTVFIAPNEQMPHPVIIGTDVLSRLPRYAINVEQNRFELSEKEEYIPITPVVYSHAEFELFAVPYATVISPYST